MPKINHAKHPFAALAASTSVLAALALSSTFAFTTGAQASTHKQTVKKAASARIARAKTWRPITIGFSSGADQLLGPDPGATFPSSKLTPSFFSAWANRAQSVGTQMVRVDVPWAWIAPTTKPTGFVATDPNDPGYDGRWQWLDTLVQNLAAKNFRIVMTVFDAPTWAEGGTVPKGVVAGTYKPNASAFGQFATAIATRYDGSFVPSGSVAALPKVSYWQGWNEPNLAISLYPQWTKKSGAKNWSAASPGIYRSLQNAFYSSVKGVSSSNYVLQAGLAPYGDNPGGARMHPVTFEQDLLCLNGKLKRIAGCAKTDLNAMDTHPYTTLAPTKHAYNKLDTSVPDISRLTKLLSAAVHAGTVYPAGSKSTWVSEVGWDTKPPDPHGTPANTEGLWVEQAAYLLWKQGVSTLLWYELGDTPPYAGQAYILDKGAFYQNGKPKPAATATKFPFLSISRKKKTVTTWGRSPAAGTLTIQDRVGGRWHTLKRLGVTKYQVFETPITLPGAAQIRAQIGNVTSLTWKVAK